MKIAYLINSYPLGSQTFIRREIRAIERLGVTIQRFALRGDRRSLVDTLDVEEFDRTEYVLTQPKLRLLASTFRTLLCKPKRSFQTIQVLLRLLRSSGGGFVRHAAYFVEACYLRERCASLGVQHLHAHFGTNSTAVAMLMEALGGPSYSFTVHGPEEFDMPQNIRLGEKVARSKFVATVSSFGRSQLYRWCAYEHWEKVKIVHCGIDVSKFEDSTELPGQRRLVTIGRFVEQKGQLLLIEAMSEACATDSALHLTMIGDGELRPVIEAAISDFGLEDNIELAGWLGEQAVRDALEKSDALILPSFAEGLPVVLMEAMAAGRPVIATNIAGIAELVRHDQHGWIVTPGDVKSLSAAMKSFACSPAEKLRSMGAAARTQALQRHDIDRSAQHLSGLFTSAVRSR